MESLVPQRDLSAHWKRLGLLDGAPEPAIEAAWLWQIARHHPDRGGDPETARAINVARDELKGQGAKPNEYVARHFDAQPWLLLGVVRDAEHDLARRVGTQLAADLGAYRRLADRVAWAVEHFGAPVVPPPGAAHAHAPRPAAPPRRRPEPRRTEAPRGPVLPGRPEGMPESVDFGTLDWGDEKTEQIKLTWRHNAPYDVKVDVPPPLRAEVAASKALPGRFVVSVSVDWDADVFTHDPNLRGHTIAGQIVLRWGGGGGAIVHVRGVALYPAVVSVSPQELELPRTRASAQARAALAVVSSARAEVEIEPPAWLRRVAGDGRERTGPMQLATNTPVRVEFAVDWAPILERAATSFASQRPVRPTGTIVLRWGDRRLEVPVQMVVDPPPA